MSPALLIPVYCVLTVLASLVGGWLPSLIQLTHVRKQLMMSLVSGVMLGVALLHMLPHAVEFFPKGPAAIQWVGASMLCGLLAMFFLLRVFHVHAHDDHEHAHQHDSGHDHQHPGAKPRGYSWGGLFAGLAIHSLLDGVAMAASVVGEAGDGTTMRLLGIGTFLAVFLHKPLDSLAITSLMHTAEWSSRSRAVVNLLFALCCPAGAVLFWIGASQMSSSQNPVIGCALAFSAGFFLCIALSDLLPEVAFHSHDRVKLTVTLLLGVALAIGVEMSHSHDHSGHDHSGDEHSGHDGHQH